MASIIADLSSSLNSASLPRWPLITRKSLTMPASSCGSRVSIRSSIWRLRETPHLQRHFVEQVARQVEADSRLLQGQPLLHAPGRGLHQRRLLRAGGMRVAHVEQPALVGVGFRGIGEVEGAIDRRDHATRG